MDTHLPQYASSPRAIMWARSVQVQVRQSPTVRREGAPTAANAHQGKEIALASADALRQLLRLRESSSRLLAVTCSWVRCPRVKSYFCDLSWAPISQRA